MTLIRSLLIAASLVALSPLARAEGESNYQYLCRLYLLTPKVDYHGDFTHKDIVAAVKLDMELCEYAIGGLRASLWTPLARMLRALHEETGVEPGLTACFRDDKYRPRAEGNANDPANSFHGGSNVTKGYGDGEACDIVGLAEEREERDQKNKVVWEWLRRNDERFGWKLIFGECDAGHVSPLKGREYTARFGSWFCKVKRMIAELKSKKDKRRGVKHRKSKHHIAVAIHLPGASHAP